MSQPRTPDGSTTSMPDIGIPVHRNRNDTGVGSQSRSSDSRSQISLTPEKRLRAIEVAWVERDTLVVILEQQCREIEQLISIEFRVRGASPQVNHYLCDRRDSPVSTVSRATLSQADEDSFVTADEYHYDQ
ncbi:hypothetical protein OUZ56_005609 [Daphnia magna]|uniref:Uncharacterized protein n=1 Tax=Daphnia magna TaxID=35525 RepID=A0ABQ9YTY9_9CRUS|nr:hypothetical protein OUZ56_005609 [Daphnia magna]